MYFSPCEYNGASQRGREKERERERERNSGREGATECLRGSIDIKLQEEETRLSLSD